MYLRLQKVYCNSIRENVIQKGGGYNNNIYRFLIGSKTMVHFDEAEVQEIGLGDTDYPQLLRAIRKPPKVLRFRGSLPAKHENNRYLWQSQTHRASSTSDRIQDRQDARRNTDTPLSPVSLKVATLLPLKARFPQKETLLALLHSDLRHFQLTQRIWLKKSLILAVRSFLNMQTTPQKSLRSVICDGTRLSLDSPKNYHCRGW